MSDRLSDLVSDEDVADALELLPVAEEHYGLRVTEIGEDGGVWAVSGQPARRRAIAAVARYLRQDPGLDAPTWAALGAAEVYPAAAFTVVSL